MNFLNLLLCFIGRRGHSLGGKVDLILMPKAKLAQSNNLEQSKVEIGLSKAEIGLSKAEIGSSKAEIVLSRDERLLRGVFQLNKENSAYGSETPNKISKSSIMIDKNFGSSRRVSQVNSLLQASTPNLKKSEIGSNYYYTPSRKNTRELGFQIQFAPPQNFSTMSSQRLTPLNNNSIAKIGQFEVPYYALDSKVITSAIVCA